MGVGGLGVTVWGFRIRVRGSGCRVQGAPSRSSTTVSRLITSKMAQVKAIIWPCLYGLDCLVCAEFTRQRLSSSQRGGAPEEHGEGDNE